MATIHDLADTFTVSSPRETTGMNWWSDEDDGDHDDLQIEAIPLDQFDWQALASLPSVPVHPLLATLTEADVAAHAEAPTESLCARLTEAYDLFWRLRGPAFDPPAGPRYEIVDDGLLIVDGRAWQQALINAPAADAQPLLDRLADNPGCLVVDEWDVDDFTPGREEIDAIAVQVALPFTTQARTWLDGLAEDLIAGPPRSRPKGYLVAPAAAQTRIMALTPIHTGAALRAVLTVRDESTAHLVTAALNELVATRSLEVAREIQEIATDLLSPSSARAVDTEIATITQEQE